MNIKQQCTETHFPANAMQMMIFQAKLVTQLSLKTSPITVCQWAELLEHTSKKAYLTHCSVYFYLM